MILILARGKLTYYEEIKDQLHDTNKDDISKADDISVGVDDFKDANENSREALADEVEGCDVDKVKTEPDDFEEEELYKDLKLMISRMPMKPWKIKSRFVIMKRLKLNLTSLKMRTRNHWRI